MKIIKDMAKSTAISIAISLLIFCIIGIVFDIRYKGSFSMEDYGFTKMVAGCIAVGLGFGVPSFVYEIESIPRPVQILIHMGTGCVIYTVTAFLVGWLGDPSKPVQMVILIALQLALAFIIRSVFVIHYKKEAKIINERIKKLGS